MSRVYNREPFLNRIAKKLNRDGRLKHVQKPVWSKNPQVSILKDTNKDELVAVLKKQCEVIHTNFIETTSSQINEQLQAIFDEYNIQSAVIWKDERSLTFGLNETMKKTRSLLHTWDPKLKEKNIEITEKADVGIVFSDITLAESGTVVLFSHKNRGRCVHLLPKIYIAIIAKSSIVPTMTQASTYIHEQIQKGEQLASCIEFITGPSNSADIELNLVVGVHGPIKAIYIVISDK